MTHVPNLLFNMNGDFHVLTALMFIFSSLCACVIQIRLMDVSCSQFNVQVLDCLSSIFLCLILFLGTKPFLLVSCAFVVRLSYMNNHDFKLLRICRQSLP